MVHDALEAILTTLVVVLQSYLERPKTNARPIRGSIPIRRFSWRLEPPSRMSGQQSIHSTFLAWWGDAEGRTSSRSQDEIWARKWRNAQTVVFSSLRENGLLAESPVNALS
jgi:hypothetical protein